MMPPSDKLGVLKAQWEKGRKKEKKKEREGGREGGWHVPSPQLAYMLMRPKLHFKELFTFFFSLLMLRFCKPPHCKVMHILFIYFIIQAAAE